MQELTFIDWTTISISVLALVISIAVFLDSKLKERTRKKEMKLKALSKCHTLLEEAIRMHPSLDYPVIFVLPDGFAEEINKKADTLTQLSWICKNQGEDDRKGASILKSMVQCEYACDDEYLTNQERRELLEKIKNLRDTVNDNSDFGCSLVTYEHHFLFLGLEELKLYALWKKPSVLFVCDSILPYSSSLATLVINDTCQNPPF